MNAESSWLCRYSIDATCPPEKCDSHRQDGNCEVDGCKCDAEAVRNVRKEVKREEGRMIITKGTVLVPVDNHHHGSARFVVDSFDVGPGFTRIIDKDGWWIGDTELNEHYKIEE